jgi:hypothetical protein
MIYFTDLFPFLGMFEKSIKRAPTIRYNLVQRFVSKIKKGYKS